MEIEEALYILTGIVAIPTVRGFWLHGSTTIEGENGRRAVTSQDVIEAAMLMERKRVGVE